MSKTSNNNLIDDEAISNTSISCKISEANMKKFRSIGVMRGHRTLAKAVAEAMMEYIKLHENELQIKKEQVENGDK